MQFLLVVLASSGPSGLGPVLGDCRAMAESRTELHVLHSIKPVGQKGTDSVVLFFL